MLQLRGHSPQTTVNTFAHFGIIPVVARQKAWSKHHREMSLVKQPVAEDRGTGHHSRPGNILPTISRRPDRKVEPGNQRYPRREMVNFTDRVLSTLYPETNASGGLLAEKSKGPPSLSMRTRNKTATQSGGFRLPGSSQTHNETQPTVAFHKKPQTTILRFEVAMGMVIPINHRPMTADEYLEFFR